MENFKFDFVLENCDFPCEHFHFAKLAFRGQFRVFVDFPFFAQNLLLI